MIMEAKAFKIPTLTELMKGVRTKRQRSADCNKKLMQVRLNYSGGKNRHNSFEVKTYKKLQSRAIFPTQQAVPRLSDNDSEEEKGGDEEDDEETYLKNMRLKAKNSKKKKRF